ncbi:vacuolar protein sorting-associated protein 16 homolog [Penaeus chinensis]|uniref:vacuolar protein sorting-associated protein 16 homolog n=1 Tax=Penaeus chinensis TaxID=139456 RepID=UPI001FB7FDF2|nr:vacuolar protein sorting-associated protein 16 homolog [Penaeus chinensis]
MAFISDWTQIGSDVFYRKHELYTMEWGGGINLGDFMVAAASYGGPIALTRDETKFTKTQQSGKPIIFVFSSSGRKISSFKWMSGYLLCLGWSRSEDLVCVQEDGAVSLYDMFGTYQHTFNMGQEVKDTQVQSAQVFTSHRETGVAVLSKSNRVFIVSNIYEPRTRKYPDIPSGVVECWCVIREERHTNVLVSQGNNLLLLNHLDQRPQALYPEWSEPGGCIVEMAVSNNSRHVALLSDTGKLWIGSSDIRIKYCEYDVKSQVKPKQIAWCGTGAVVLLWDMTLEVVSVNGDATSYYLDSASHLVQEPDGVRVLGSTAHDLLQKVPLVVTETLGIGSMAPGALLLEAAKGFQERSTRANDCLAMIKDTLEEAVNHCLQAAQHEYRPQTQKMLLRAALFGKSFLPEINPDPCKKAIFTLRVLNAVRDYRVGLPLTWNQLEHLTLPVLLDRLVFRRFFPLALQIASFLKMPESDGASRILAHWACYKVLQPSQKSDEQIAKEINSKLGYTPGISYTDIANRADQAGRKQLAIKLIEYECRAKEQVLVLMRLGEDQTALRRALQSGDTDLIYTVLHHLRQKLSSGDFLMFIRNFPVAQSLHIRSCRELDMEQLRDILVQEDDFHGQSLLRIKEAYMSNRTDMRQASLQGAAELFRKAKNETACQMTEEQVKLVRWQVRLEDGQHKPYVNKSLYDTLHQLLIDGQIKEAEKLKTEFKIPERRYWWSRVLAHSQAGHWEELLNFSKNKKNPIGFEPFVDACLKNGNKSEAQKYAMKVKDENKVTYLIKCGLLEEAVKVAQEQRSALGLSEVLAACGSQHQALQTKIQVLLSDSSLRN